MNPQKIDNNEISLFPEKLHIVVQMLEIMFIMEKKAYVDLFV